MILMFHILVVDDDKNTRRYMQAVLEEAHYTVTTAENGVRALDIMAEEHIDLIVLDIMMPEMDGYTHPGAFGKYRIMFQS